MARLAGRCLDRHCGAVVYHAMFRYVTNNRSDLLDEAALGGMLHTCQSPAKLPHQFRSTNGFSERGSRISSTIRQHRGVYAPVSLRPMEIVAIWLSI